MSGGRSRPSVHATAGDDLGPIGTLPPVLDTVLARETQLRRPERPPGIARPDDGDGTDGEGNTQDFLGELDTIVRHSRLRRRTLRATSVERSAIRLARNAIRPQTFAFSKGSTRLVRPKPAPPDAITRGPVFKQMRADPPERYAAATTRPLRRPDRPCGHGAPRPTHPFHSHRESTETMTTTRDFHPAAPRRAA